MSNTNVKFYDTEFSSRLLIGTALYPSPAIMQQAIRASGAQIVTVSVRRETAGGKAGDAFWSLIRELELSPSCPTPPAAAACARPSPPRSSRANCSAPPASSSR